MYARPQNEAPGHLEARPWEYRVVSRGWHHLLGFTGNSTSTKWAQADLDPDDLKIDSIVHKRRKHIHLDGVAGKNFGDWSLSGDPEDGRKASRIGLSM